LKLKFTILALILGLTAAVEARQTDDSYRFTILHTNDEHSHLIPTPSADDHPEYAHSATGGIARLAGLIRQIRQEKEAQDEPVLLFSGGIIWRTGFRVAASKRGDCGRAFAFSAHGI
jgi:5'-nucleotidase / UDP-sugar diphosphatase